MLAEEVLHLCCLGLCVEVTCDPLDQLGEQAAAGVLSAQHQEVLFEEVPGFGKGDGAVATQTW